MCSMPRNAIRAPSTSANGRKYAGPAAPEEEGGAAGRLLFRSMGVSRGSASGARSARSPRDVARLEAQAREPVAADELVAAAGGRDEHEAPRRGGGRVAGRVAGTKLAGGERGGGHGKHDRAAGPALRWPVVQETTQRQLPPGWTQRARASRARGRAARAASPAPGAGARASVAPLKARLATVAKPVSSSRSASSRCAVRSADGSAGRRRARTSSARGGRRGARAARPPPPRARRRGRPRSSTSPVRACSSRASWPTRSPSRPSAVASARLAAPPARAHDLRAAVGVQLGDRPRRARARARRPGASHGSTPTRIPAVTTNGTLWAAVLSVHRRPRARSARASTGRRQATRGALGQRAGRAGTGS